MNFNKIHVLVEGYTEELFVKRVLNPFFQPSYLNPIIVTTSISASSARNKGGTVKFNIFQKQLNYLLNDTSAKAVTMMLDFHGIHSSFRGGCNHNLSLNQVHCIENFLARAINNPRFIPFILLHEFESLLFSDDEIIRSYGVSVNLPPEEINSNNPPSKRLIAAREGYSKTIDGLEIAEKISIHKMINKCPHFRSWISKIQEAFT